MAASHLGKEGAVDLAGNRHRIRQTPDLRANRSAGVPPDFQHGDIVRHSAASRGGGVTCGTP
jgi:hypothetical protein